MEAIFWEAVAVHNFGVTGNVVFSKAFYDVYVAMGGCGTTVSVLIALLLFFRKERTGKLAGLASFTVVFNLMKCLTFGIPIILNRFCWSVCPDTGGVLLPGICSNGMRFPAGSYP